MAVKKKIVKKVVAKKSPKSHTGADKATLTEARRLGGQADAIYWDKYKKGDAQATRLSKQDGSKYNTWVDANGAEGGGFASSGLANKSKMDDARAAQRAAASAAKTKKEANSNSGSFKGRQAIKKTGSLTRNANRSSPKGKKYK